MIKIDANTLINTNGLQMATARKLSVNSATWAISIHYENGNRHNFNVEGEPEKNAALEKLSDNTMTLSEQLKSTKKPSTRQPKSDPKR